MKMPLLTGPTQTVMLGMLCLQIPFKQRLYKGKIRTTHCVKWMSYKAAKVGLTTDQCCCLAATKWIISGVSNQAIKQQHKPKRVYKGSRTSNADFKRRETIKKKAKVPS